MASRGSVRLFLLSYLFLFSSLSCASQKVSLDFYYETLCPYCSNFIVNHLVKLFDKGLINIVDLKLVPYGNARIGSNATITCQHGPVECLLNTVEACAINVWPELNKHFTFIYCVERLVLEGKYTTWESCFKQLGLDPKPIAGCYNSGYGKKLDQEYAAQTNALQPPHKYVPWVVVNGKPLYEDYVNYVTYVCKAYKGAALPKACSEELSLEINHKEKANPIRQVCYREDTATSTSSSTYIRSIKGSWRRQMKQAVSV